MQQINSSDSVDHRHRLERCHASKSKPPRQQAARGLSPVPVAPSSLASSWHGGGGWEVVGVPLLVVLASVCLHDDVRRGRELADFLLRLCTNSVTVSAPSANVTTASVGIVPGSPVSVCGRERAYPGTPASAKRAASNGTTRLLRFLITTCTCCRTHLPFCSRLSGSATTSTSRSWRRRSCRHQCTVNTRLAIATIFGVTQVITARRGLTAGSSGALVRVLRRGGLLPASAVRPHRRSPPVSRRLVHILAGQDGQSVALSICATSASDRLMCSNRASRTSGSLCQNA